MHAIMTLTARHDRYMSSSPGPGPTTFETFHGLQAASLFNRMLSGPIHASDGDTIGAMGALLGAISIASTEACSPEEAWPLKAPAPSDLQWLKLSDGKRELWRLANPSRPESVFRCLVEEYEDNARILKPGIEKLPTQLLEICDVTELSTADNNPYYSALQIFASMQDVECNHSTILRFLSFIGDVQPEFITLIELKDSRALLLLAFWYATVCHYHWWIARRAMIECKAICIYLEKSHASKTTIQDLLQYPKLSCGLIAQKSGVEDITMSRILPSGLSSMSTL